MSAAVAMHKIVPNQRKSCWLGTPEIYFRKPIDNSRLVKVEDPRRAREMRQFTVVLALLFVLVMGYAWQHFRAIEYGYRIESLRAQRDLQGGLNQELRLEESSLRDPGRVDAWARKMGLQPPDPGQVQRMDSSADLGAPVVAQVRPVSVVSAQ
jgi:cell division protein FtsL